MSQIRTALILFWSVGFFSQQASAGLDYNLGVDLGSMSYWSNASATLGYGFLLWGDDPLKALPKEGFARPDEYLWQYGYIRPEVRIESSVSRNAAMAEIELSPISWIILSAGKSIEERSDNGRLEYNCVSASCEGKLERTRLTVGGFPMGIGRFFLGGFSRWDFIQSQDKPRDRDFVDQMSGLVGRTSEDTLRTDAILGGIVITKKIVLGGGYIGESFDKSEEKSNLGFGSLTYDTGKFSITAVAGERKRSSQPDSEFWGVLSIKWIGRRALGQ